MRGVERRGGGPHAHHVRRALGLRRDAPGVRRRRRAWTAGSPSRWTRGWPTTPSRPSPRPRRCGGWSTGRTCSSRSRRPRPGLPAITATLAEGISVNVTLIFGLDRYTQVMDAFLAGLEQAKANGHDLSKIGSVASFFVSRVDTEVDKRLDKIGTRRGARRCTGKAAIANARLAYERYERGLRLRPVAGAGRRRRPPAAAAVGVHLDQEPGLPGRHVRRGADRARHGQHHAGGGHPRVRRPRRDPAATPSPARTTTAQAGARPSWPRSASTTTTWSPPWNARAWRSSRRAGWSCSTASRC